MFDLRSLRSVARMASVFVYYRARVTVQRVFDAMVSAIGASDGLTDAQAIANARGRMSS